MKMTKQTKKTKQTKQIEQIKQTEHTDDSVICNLKVWHKPFGWLMVVAIVLFLPLSSLEPLQWACGLLALWSALREREIIWRVNEAQWGYRTRNFLVWREIKYEMTANDMLTLTWNRTESSSALFSLKFEPKSAQFIQRHQMFESYDLEVLPTHTGEAELTATMKKIGRIYGSCNIGLNADVALNGLNDKKSEAIHAELGIDFLPVQSDEKQYDHA
ncbi:hypothetical protein KCN56_05955 [Photobacterium galatheae]|nr:hypothetical protein [Photobacterium galatheae]MCM0148117.1 hypothetical protein [Photobacterium galatheae]